VAAEETRVRFTSLVSEKLLYQTGLQVGDILTMTRAGTPGPITLEIVALWSPVDASDPSWILTPKFFDNVFLMQTADLWTALESLENPVEEVDWQIIFDGSTLRTSDVAGLLDGMVAGQRTTATLPGIRLDLSPEEALRAFSRMSAA
jgi:hypothetical protein